MAMGGTRTEAPNPGFVAFMLNSKFEDKSGTTDERMTRLGANKHPFETRGIDKELEHFEAVFVERLGLKWINKDTKFRNLTATDWNHSANEVCTDDDPCLRCNILSRDYSSSRFFVLVVSSHGSEEQEPIICMSDSSNLLMSEITDVLRDKKLVDVTKILILQTCRAHACLSAQYFADLSTRIGSEWSLLGVKLGISRVGLDQMQKDFLPDVSACIEFMLTSWREEHNGEDVASALAVALTKVGQEDLEQEMKYRLVNRDGLSDQYIEVLSGRIGSEWPLIGVKLGISHADLDQMQKDYLPNVSECIERMLTSWHDDFMLKHKSDDRASSALSEALREVGREDLEREIKGRLSKRYGLSAQYLADLSTRIRSEWPLLGVKLRFSRAGLDQMQKDFLPNVSACIGFMLTSWREEHNGEDVTSALAVALTEVGQEDLEQEMKYRLVNRDGLSDQYIEVLSGRIGSEWPLIGVKLGISRADLDQMQKDYLPDVSECIECMLTAWHQDFTLKHKCEDLASSVLSEALREVGREDLEGEIKDRLSRRYDSGVSCIVQGGGAENDTTTEASSGHEETGMDPTTTATPTNQQSQRGTDQELNEPTLRLQEPPLDFLIVYSTTTGRLSCSHDEKGSWMLHSMNEVMTKLKAPNPNFNFLKFLTESNALVCEKITTNMLKKDSDGNIVMEEGDPVIDENAKYKSTMCISHRLTTVPKFELKQADDDDSDE